MRVAAAVLTLVAPVGGPVARGFDYGPDPFLAGQHRGIDLAAPPGSVVRAACTGTVAAAGMHVVTLRCGPWRVSELPLASVGVRVGARVRAGSVLGRAGALAGHVGVHLGVRREGDPFGYVDPEPLLRGAATRPPVASTPRRIPRAGPPSSVRAAMAGSAVAAGADAAPTGAAETVAGGAAPAPAQSERRSARLPAGVRVSAGDGGGALAPWPAWLGLALLALGAAGGGVRLGLRRRVPRLAEPAVEGVPSAS